MRFVIASQRHQIAIKCHRAIPWFKRLIDLRFSVSTIKHEKFTQRSCLRSWIGGAWRFINVTKYIFIAISTIPLHWQCCDTKLSYFVFHFYYVVLFRLATENGRAEWCFFLPQRIASVYNLRQCSCRMSIYLRIWYDEKLIRIHWIGGFYFVENIIKSFQFWVSLLKFEHKLSVQKKNC